MAKLATSVTLFLFLFTLSHARDIQTPFPEPKPEYEAEIQPEPKKPQPVEPKRPQPLESNEPQTLDTVALTIDSIDPVPSTFLPFRPINRHLNPGRPLPLSLRTGHRRCRHGPRREIPYGNDAIVLSDAAGGDRKDGVRQIPTRWARFEDAAEPRFPETVGHPDSDHEQLHHVHGEHHHPHHPHHPHHGHEEGWLDERVRSFLNMF